MISHARQLLLLVSLCLLTLGATARAQLLSGKGAELPLAVIVTPHFRVLHPPRLEPYARRVAAAAERVRAAVLGTVGNDPGLTYILLGDETDDFNGYATPGPYPFIRLYPTFPRPTDIGAQFQDVFVALVGHELTHVAHLTTRDALRDTARGIFGAVPGLLDARVPPAWFVEGYAVYLESRITTGGRVRDSTTRTLRRAIARGGRFPSLSDAGIGTLETYPFGNTRYVFGAGFVNFLVGQFGEDGLRRAIRRYNETLTFADAWRAEFGVSLEALWGRWATEETEAARAEAVAARQSGLPAGTVLHAGSGIPVWQNATRYAYLQGNSVRFASLNGGAERLEPGFVTLPSRPNRLSFASDGALVYSRLTARGATTYGELFSLEAGRERQLTTGAHARDAVADGNCILYVRESPLESSLRRFCAGRDETVFVPPAGWHLFQPAPGPSGIVALSVWRPGGFLDIALLRAANLEFLTSDAAQDQFPGWQADGRLVFSSDRSGTAQLYVTEPGSGVAAQLSANPNGALASAQTPDGDLAFSGYTAAGLETRLLGGLRPAAAQALGFAAPAPLEGLDGLDYPLEPFQPNLAPVFWSPVTANGLGATVYGVDQAGVNSYQVALGYDLTGGSGLNASADYSFAPRPDWSLNLGASASLNGTWSAQISAPFTGQGEAVSTGRFEYTVTPFLTGGSSGMNLGLSLRFDALQQDVFGYVLRGWRLTSSVGTQGFGASLALADVVSGLPLAVTARIALRGASDPDLALHIQTHTSFQIHWRFPDGFAGLERITVLPFAALRLGANTGYTLGLQVFADLTLNYYVPFSLGVEGTWDGNAFGFRLVTLIPLLEGLR